MMPAFASDQIILVDTTVVHDLMKPNHNPNVAHNIVAYSSATIFISVITVHEILYGIAGMDDGKRKREREVAATEIMGKFRGLPIDAEIASIAAQLRDQKKKQGHDPDKLGLDMFIAATALCHKMFLFTSDHDFNDIKDLPIFDPRTRPA